MRMLSRRCAVLATALLLLCCALSTASSQPPQRPPGVSIDGIRIGHVRILGHVGDLDVARLARRLGLEQGAPFDSVAVERARARLLELGWLRSIELLHGLPAPDSLVVAVLVERAPRARLLPVFDRRPDDRLVFGAKLSTWGRSGRGEHFQFRVLGFGQELVQARWLEPRPFFALPVAMRFEVATMQEIEATETDLEFDRLVLGAAIAIPARGPHLEFSGSVAQVRASAPEGVVAAAGVDHIRHGAIDFVWGKPRALFEWSALRGRVGVGATSGIVQNQELHLETSAALGLSERVVLAAGAGFRDRRGVVARYDRVHLGGGRTLRAHRYGVANGDGGAWGGLEVRVPVNFWSLETLQWTMMPLALHAFADAGSAWSATVEGAATESVDRQHASLRWSAGAGFTVYFRRLIPVRFDVGAGDGGIWRADFSTTLPF